MRVEDALLIELTSRQTNEGTTKGSLFTARNNQRQVSSQGCLNVVVYRKDTQEAVKEKK